MIILAYSLVCLIFGTTFLAIKIGVDAGAPPFFSAGLRFFAAGAALLLWMSWKRKASFSLLLRKETALTGLGLTFGTFAALYWAEQYVSSGLAAVLSATGPIMILLLQTFLLRQKASSLSLAGCLIGFTGVLLLVLPSLSLSASPLWLAGCAVILIGEWAYASGTLYTRTVTARLPDVHPIALNAAQMIYGGALMLLLSLFAERPSISFLLSWRASGSFLYLTVIGSMVGHSLYYWLVAKTNPVFPSTWLYISPPIAVGVGIFFYDETVSWMTLLGVITIIGGTMLVNAKALKQLLARFAPGSALNRRSAGISAFGDGFRMHQKINNED
ncbi:Permease of the drug/metabolite transporter (DMT) superfamily [Paenibacillus sophorae]|uniref:EamA family transporter n=1 Tax=Paenibacillus sophorae TaxID=1333845 RepID=A0A1H8LLT1_9BACL|nr:EamA family transporter [Paenibacillus sophorae]QWU17239.1 EamA family transporter [Paenibacillus sophorae]SEO06039.1 Permease of the drug/metabolite transporter (DMT) superfamily [Paenibacillus sophorae]